MKSISNLKAVESVHRALAPLDAEDRKRVLQSVFALLDISGFSVQPSSAVSNAIYAEPIQATTSPLQSTSTRPTSIVELMKEKKPGTSAQRITLIAYYREKFESQARFARRDIEAYFAKAKEPLPANFDRDFVEAVKKGWVHEDADESYITSRGIEAVESGFAGERKYKTAKPSGKTEKSKPNRSHN